MAIRILDGERIKKTSSHTHGSGASLFSAGYWIKPVTGSTFTSDDFSNHSGLHRHRCGLTNYIAERLWFATAGLTNLLTSTTLTTDEWQFIVVTHDASGVQKVYRNGVDIYTGSVAENLATIGATAEFLGDPVPNWEADDEAYFGGIFRIAGKALSEAEVQALYANRTGGGGSAKPQDHIASGVTVHCAAFDESSTDAVTDGDAALADLGDTANPWILSTGTPAYVADNPGHTWSVTTPPWTYTPNSPDYVVSSAVANLLHGGDCRVITEGDSFNRWFLPARLMPFGWLTSDPKVNLTAFCSGDPLAAANGLMRAYNAATGTTFEVENGNYEVENGSGQFFALPVSEIRGFLCDVGLTLNGGTRFVQYRWRNGTLATAGQRNWLSSTDRAKVRPLFLAAVAGADQLPDITIKDVNAATNAVCDFTTDGCRKRYADADDPRTDGGGAVLDAHINACYPDIELANTSTEFHLDILAGSTNPVSTDQFLQTAGAVLYKVDGSGNRIPGLYYTTLDGNSWSYNGFNADDPSGALDDKTFSDAQFRAWLDVTTLDPGQRVVIIQNIADEDIDQATHKTKLEAFITRHDARCLGITTQPPLYLFIVQFAHEMTGDPDVERQNQIYKCDALYEIAQANSRVNYISLYQIMDGTYATTDVASGVTGGLAEYAAWATARGWDAFTNNGTYAAVDLTVGLLDPDLHIGGTEEATAIGSLIAEVLDASESRGRSGNVGSSIGISVGV